MTSGYSSEGYANKNTIIVPHLISENKAVRMAKKDFDKIMFDNRGIDEKEIIVKMIRFQGRDIWIMWYCDYEQTKLVECRFFTHEIRLLNDFINSDKIKDKLLLNDL